MYDDEMTLGQWIGTLILVSIPCVNLVMLIIWAAGSGNSTRKKFAQAYLIVMAIVFVITFVAGLLFGASLMAMLPSTYMTQGSM